MHASAACAREAIAESCPYAHLPHVGSLGKRETALRHENTPQSRKLIFAHFKPIFHSQGFKIIEGQNTTKVIVLLLDRDKDSCWTNGLEVNPMCV